MNCFKTSCKCKIICKCKQKLLYVIKYFMFTNRKNLQWFLQLIHRGSFLRFLQEFCHWIKKKLFQGLSHSINALGRMGFLKKNTSTYLLGMSQRTFLEISSKIPAGSFSEILWKLKKKCLGNSPRDCFGNLFKSFSKNSSWNSFTDSIIFKSLFKEILHYEFTGILGFF